MIVLDGLMRVAALKQGETVDALDELGSWLEAKIRSIDHQSGTVTIHFKGWSERYDRIVATRDLSTNVAPLHSRTVNWRGALELFEIVEYLTMNNKGRQWVEACVTEINRVDSRLKLEFKTPDGVGEAVVSLSGEEICKAGTHLKSLR
jgi:hypothetical protein